jgi:CobQ-like glutamine amidotransferase family enzyme
MFYALECTSRKRALDKALLLLSQLVEVINKAHMKRMSRSLVFLLICPSQQLLGAFCLRNKMGKMIRSIDLLSCSKKGKSNAFSPCGFSLLWSPQKWR